MEHVLRELDTIHFNDCLVLYQQYGSKNINQLAYDLLANQKANFSNSQIDFIKNALPAIVEQAQRRKDRLGTLSPEFMEALLLQAYQFDPKMSKKEKKILKTALESNFPQDMEQYMKLFNIFTESQDRDWLVSRYISGGIRLIEDINSRAKPAIVDFKKFVKQGYLSGDLSQFATLPELEEAIEPFLEKQELKNKGQSNVVYEDSQFRVIQLLDETASCYYGQGTKWCTAATKGDNMFNYYKEDGPVFVLLIKTPRYKGEKYQFRFFPEFFIADEQDEELTLEEMQDRYSNIREILEKVYVKMMAEAEKIGLFNSEEISVEITPHFIITDNIYFKDKWLIVNSFSFVLFNATKYIIGVKSNPDNLPELTTKKITDFINTNYSHLIFGYSFNPPVEHLPRNLTHLTFGKWFNKPVDHLPKNLTHLTFGWEFNQPVNNLPPKLTHLTFDYNFNQPVDHLPLNLTDLTFGWKFNQPVKFLAKLIHLTQLTFKGEFNQPIESYLPKNLTHLTFGYRFNQPVNHLPPNLTHLTFGYYFNQPLNNLPQNLNYLIVSKKYSLPINLPPNTIMEYEYIPGAID